MKVARDDSGNLIRIISPNPGTVRLGTNPYLLNRRLLISQLYLSGTKTLAGIAEDFEKRYHVKVSTKLISKDLKFLMKEWQEATLKNTHEIVQEETAKLDMLIQVALDGLKEGTLSVKDFCTEMTRIMKRKAAMLGLDKAEKIDLNVKRTSDLGDDELESIIKKRGNEVA